MTEKTEKEAEKYEAAFRSALLSAILTLRPWNSVYIITVWEDFSKELLNSTGTLLQIHDMSAASAYPGFDALDKATLAREAMYREQFIREFGDETRKAVDMAFNWAGRKGLTPEETQKILTAVAGLNQRQTGALLMQWASRQDSGAKMMDRMLDRASRKYLKERVTMTASTEAWRMLEMGKFSAMSQVVSSGKTVTKFWDVTPDERLCENCAPIPGMNPDGVDLGTPFRTPLGDAMISPLHPRCRCHVRYEIHD